MTKRMLIDATHAEETRVVVLDANRLEDFDVETSTKRQLKGNIYLAKVVRVEPSLQAAFVEYGGNRHGFLAFSEIHPDYYQIPVADRQRLIDQEAEEAQREEEEADRELEGTPQAWAPAEPPPALSPIEASEPQDEPSDAPAAEVSPDSAPQPWLPAPEGPADSVTGSNTPSVADEAAMFPGGPGDHVTGAAAAAPGDAAPEPEAAVRELGDSLTGAIAAAPADDLAATATSASATGSTDHVTGSAALTSPDLTPEPNPAPSPPDTISAQIALPSDATAPTPEAPTSEQDSPEHDEEPAPRTRPAQPLIIDQETRSGPVEIGASDDEPDVFVPASPASEADTEHDPDLADPDFADPDLADDESIPESPPPETVGGESDGADEQRERRMPSRYLRNYKIQEVIRRRQILLVQVVKEERGTKGAALTTYLSLAGRFSVLMPNSPRGGGISRKITSAADRRRLKEAVAELEMPKGMGLIVRTAGANRPKPEIKRDCEYLLRLWDEIREHTLKSVAPALIYEEASLIKRAIRDVYSRDIDEIQVDGEEGWQAAHGFMRMLMPSHAKKVQLWRDPSQPLFTKYQVESQLDAMLQPTVQLRSGGYLVINQTEALVAIDVNSGRSTRERNVEETALRTNLEAADEVARQLRLRDLAGLIVIDFIDMESKKHNAMVERRMKEALKNDRARIQVGHISHFGLLEMSRQRLRPSLAEASFILCPHCGGTGHVRSTENAAIHVLRGIEDEGSKRRSAEIVVHAAMPTALYILNHKRDRLREIEQRYAMRVTVMGDDTQVASQFRIDRVRPQVAREEVPAAITPDAPPPAWPAPRFEPEEADQVIVEDDVDLEEPDAEEVGADGPGADGSSADEDDDAEEAAGEAGRADGAEGAAAQAERRRRRRRRRRGGRREDGTQSPQTETAGDLVSPETEPTQAPDQVQGEPAIAAADDDTTAPETHIEGVPEHAEQGDDDARRRRGRRGGRRRRREPGEGEGSPFAAPGAEQPDLPPVYLGPTPANPFGGQAFDIFDVLEQAEASATARQEPAEPEAWQSPPQPEIAVAAEGEAEPEIRQSLPEPEAVAALESTAETPAAPEGLTEPEAAAAARSLPEPEAAVAPRSLPEPEATAAPQSLTEPEPMAGSQSLPEPEAAAAPQSLAEPEPMAGSQSLPEPEAAAAPRSPTKPEPMAAPRSPPEPEPMAAPQGLTEPETVPAPTEATVPAEPLAPFAQEIVNATAPEPTPTYPTIEQPAAPEPAHAEAANDAAPEPAIRPIIIGSGDDLAEKKRGWWRR